MHADMLRAKPASMYSARLHFVAPATPLRGCIIRERGFEMSFSAARPRQWAAIRSLRWSDPLVNRRAREGGADLSDDRWSAPLTHRRLSLPSFLFAFFALKHWQDLLRTLFGWTKRKGGFGTSIGSSEQVNRLDLRDGVWRYEYDLVSCRGF